MYYIIWKYKVSSNNKVMFENEYGSNGSWNNLFSKSKNYHGSDLIKNTSETNEYLLVDKWTTKEAYHEFIQMNSSTYSNLSSQFSTIYESEELIGNFSQI